MKIKLLAMLLLASTLAVTGCGNKNSKSSKTSQENKTQAAEPAPAAQSNTEAQQADVVAGNVWSDQMQEQLEILSAATADTGAVISKTAQNQLKIQIPSDASFSIGRSKVKPDFKKLLNVLVSTLVSNPSAVTTIIGHTDSTGSDAINDPLSLERAGAVSDYIVEGGVEDTRIYIDGKGSREPVADNDTPENRAKNRRVEIFVNQPV